MSESNVPSIKPARENRVVIIGGGDNRSLLGMAMLAMANEQVRRPAREPVVFVRPDNIRCKSCSGKSGAGCLGRTRCSDSEISCVGQASDGAEKP